ncbi:formylglycine-generating enzyme family protein [Marinobacter halotolerans]|uniref:formylglycine-generating enzyme family protein n=1 Tax=Marinobacter halotolerans TaxID=1569211 RepID=UPI001246D60F|nr:SUMF1/EgtB/PvdO family nonheme iron enzyme [Marinobacter halotolerans]
MQRLLILISTLTFGGCFGNSNVTSNEVSIVTEKALSNMVFVEGGTFLLGDIGVLRGSAYTTLQDNNKPPVEVTLNSFSISKYETTWGEFVVYLKEVGRLEQYTVESGFVMANKLPISSEKDPQSPNFYQKPARSPNYSEAEGYCQWLATKTGLPISLPSEAQWEYAARNRGEDVPYATDDGRMQNDTYLQRPDQYIDPETPPSGNALSHSSMTTERRAVGSYPPSPLGLYDMTGNVAEWTKDWYASDAYRHIQGKNPSGPEQPENTDKPEKVVRDWAGRGEHFGGGGTVFARAGSAVSSSNNGFRCVVNRTEPLS